MKNLDATSDIQQSKGDISEQSTDASVNIKNKVPHPFDFEYSQIEIFKVRKPRLIINFVRKSSKLHEQELKLHQLVYQRPL
jgi:hypothetical protein